MIKKYVKHFISKLFFRYCFKESELASFLSVYFIPDTMRNVDGSKLNGQYFFAELTETHYKHIVDLPACGLEESTH